MPPTHDDWTKAYEVDYDIPDSRGETLKLVHTPGPSSRPSTGSRPSNESPAFSRPSTSSSSSSEGNLQQHPRPSTSQLPSAASTPSTPSSLPRAPPGTSDYFSRRPRDPDTRVLARNASPLTRAGAPPLPSRGSMILYHVSPNSTPSDDPLLPPRAHFGAGHPNRSSLASTSGDSVISFSEDSKYPVGPIHLPGAEHGLLVPYVYDPDLDEPDLNDFMHDPKVEFVGPKEHRFPWRGLMNMSALLAMVLGLAALFIIYPAYEYTTNLNGERNFMIVNNPRINSTGQAIEEWIPVGGGRPVSSSRITSATTTLTTTSTSTSATTTSTSTETTSTDTSTTTSESSTTSFDTGFSTTDTFSTATDTTTAPTSTDTTIPGTFPDGGVSDGTGIGQDGLPLRRRNRSVFSRYRRL